MYNKQMKTEKHPLVSVIIPNYNGEAFIENCIDSLGNQSFRDFEIVVVDDGSTDRSVEIIQKKYPDIRLFINENNAGFDASVNRGIQNSRGDYLILLNNDVVVDPGFVKALVEALSAEDKIFSVSSKMIRYYERNILDDAGDMFHVLGWAFKRGDGCPANTHNAPRRIFSTCAGAGIYKKSVLDEIGLFDEAFFAYMEDVDLAYRAMVVGYENRYEPRAICYHIGSATTAEGNKYSDFKVKLSARNNVYTVYKNMPPLQLAGNMPFLVLGFGIKALFFMRKGYGKSYLSGLKEGLSTTNRVKRVKFKKKNLPNYIKIQGMLMSGLALQLAYKGCGALKKQRARRKTTNLRGRNRRVKKRPVNNV